MALFLGTSPALAAGDPKIQFQEYEWDFGDMYQKEERSYTFIFTNVGEGDLIIRDTKTSCGCTAAVASDKAVPPGEKGEIRVTYNSKSTKGDQSKTVTVHSNAPDSVTTLVVKAKVKVDVNYPSTVQFGAVGNGKKSEQAIEVVAEPGLAFEVVKVETDAPFITSSFEKGAPSPEGGTTFKVMVALGESAPVGTVSNRLRVFTNLEKKPVIEIPVYARVEGNLKLSSESVNFGRFAPGEAQNVVITVEAPKNHPVKVTAARSTTPDVVVELKTVKDKQVYEVHCSVASGKQTGNVAGKLIIETDDPHEAMRELHMIGFVKKS